MVYNAITLAVKKNGVHGFYRRHAGIITKVVNDISFVEDSLNHIESSLTELPKHHNDKKLDHFIPSDCGFIALDIDNYKVIVASNFSQGIGMTCSYKIMGEVFKPTDELVDVFAAKIPEEMAMRGMDNPHMKFEKKLDGKYDAFFITPICKGVDAFYDSERTETVRFREFYEAGRIKNAMCYDRHNLGKSINLDKMAYIDIIQKFCPGWKVKPDLKSIKINQDPTEMKEIYINYDLSPFEIERYEASNQEGGLDRLIELGFDINNEIKSDWLNYQIAE